MRLTVFPADDGDCLLLRSTDGKHILIDGGRSGSFKRHALEPLAALEESGTPLDVVCVSHIDADHISGILTMLGIELDWRVFQHHADNNDSDFRRPKRRRPAQITEMWHNGFHEMAGFDQLDAQRVGDARATIDSMSRLVTGTEFDASRLTDSYAYLATSVPQALELVARLSDRQLGIKINERFGERLITTTEEPVTLGDLTITFVGPTQDELDDLKKAWTKEFEAKKKQIERLRDEMAGQDRRLTATADLTLFTKSRDAIAARLGDRSKVTPPNLASLMFLIEEGRSKALFTGDGAAQDILRGLEEAGRMEQDGTLHVDLLKVQHHGSEFNLNSKFCSRVTADRYVISGNGRHHNPDLKVIRAIVNSRRTDRRAFAETAEAGNDFTIYMATSIKLAKPSFKPYLKKVFALLLKLEKDLRGQMKIEFPDGAIPLEIDI